MPYSPERKKEYDHQRYQKDKENQQERSRQRYRDDESYRKRQKTREADPIRQQARRTWTTHTLNGRFYSIRNSAKKRSIAFDLALTEAEQFWQVPCAYCGEITPSLNLDRIDSKGPYSLANCVPCCPVCNMMKQELSVEAFLAHIRQIMEHTSDQKHYGWCFGRSG